MHRARNQRLGQLPVPAVWAVELRLRPDCGSLQQVSSWLRLCGTLAPPMRHSDSAYAALWLRLCGTLAPPMRHSGSAYAALWLRLCDTMAPPMRHSGSAYATPWLRLCGSLGRKIRPDCGRTSAIKADGRRSRRVVKNEDLNRAQS